MIKTAVAYPCIVEKYKGSRQKKKRKKVHPFLHIMEYVFSLCSAASMLT